MKNISVRRRLLYSLLNICLCNPVLSGQRISVDSLSVSRFGKVYIYVAVNVSPQNLIIMISGDGGWKYGVPEFAGEFARMNSVVVAGVDILRYYRHLKQQVSDCYMVSSDFVELAAAVEQKYNFHGYTLPVIMGYSSGATLVYGIMAQARPGTFAGGISLGFCPDIELPRMLCQVNGLTEKEVIKDIKYVFEPDNRLGNPWYVLHGQKDEVCNFEAANEFVRKTANAKLIPLPEVGHGFSAWKDFMPQWKEAYNEIIRNLTTEYLQDSQKDHLRDIPLIIARGKAGTDNPLIAVFFSGDGGWYGFEQSIADRLANSGISTIGIDTKKYFWAKKTPEKTASDVASLFYYYGRSWNISQFMLIGYSQGAEVLPFVLNRLPSEVKSRIISAVMLSPEKSTDFEIHLTNMLGIGNSRNTFDVISEIRNIQDIRQIIILGSGENTKVPELLKDSRVEIVRIPGDHHYKGNSALIVQTMKDKEAF